MKPKRPAKAIQSTAAGFDGLLRGLREFIGESRRQVLPMKSYAVAAFANQR